MFGEYPFAKDGYKLIEVPYSGMEHQSAVTYGNRFANGYLERDWTGVGVSLKFDFIIIHESAHEWFGNAVSAADVSDMWIQEGWATYLEGVYVEQLFGSDDALKYMNGYKSKVAQPGADHHAARHPSHRRRRISISRARSSCTRSRQRRADDDDAAVVEAAARRVSAVQVQEHHDRGTGGVHQHAGSARTSRRSSTSTCGAPSLPTLELAFNDADEDRGVSMEAEERAFAMPIRVGARGNWQVITPTTDWQLMPATLAKDAFEVATDLYYVNVVKH